METAMITFVNVLKCVNGMRAGQAVKMRIFIQMQVFVVGAC